MTDNLDVYSAMQTGNPVAIYRKTITGKVHITVLDPFDGTPHGKILEGDSDKSYVRLWDAKQLLFFQAMNKDNIDAGRLIMVETVPVAPPSPNIISPEEIDELLESKFFKLKARVEQFTDTAPVLRILNRAQELDKSAKIIGYLKSQMSAIELAQYEKS